MKLRRVAALSAALLLVGATAASAAGPPYTVAVGGNSAAGTEAVTATSSGSVSFSARNNSNTVLTMSCSSVSGNGTVTRGTGVNPVATITSTTWSGCFLFGAMTVQQSGTWSIVGSGTNATAAATDSVPGAVSNVSGAVLTTSNPAICSFTVVGQARSIFNEATQQLVVSETGYTGNLSLANVRGCLGRLQSGNPANFATTLNVTSPGGAINLS